MSVLHNTHRTLVDFGVAVKDHKHALAALREAHEALRPPVEQRLLAGDPDWKEFKRRWADEYGALGDET